MKALDSKSNHRIYSVIVPSGGGKSTQCALLSDERMLITGLVGVDKDAMLTAYETGEPGTSDAMMTAATPMMTTDVAGSDDDGDEGATNVRVDMEQVKRVTESTGTYIWNRIRAIEREARGLAGGVNILVMLHKPYEGVV